MLHAATIVTVMVLVLLVPAAPAAACACVANPPPSSLSPEAEAAWQLETLRRNVATEFDRAAAVFSGEVLADNVGTVRFKLARAWKGDLPAEFDMDTGYRENADGSVSFNSCDYLFKVGSTYVVFAFGKSIRTMKASSCTQTSELPRAGRTVEALDALVTSRDKSRPKADHASAPRLSRSPELFQHALVVGRISRTGTHPGISQRAARIES